MKTGCNHLLITVPLCVIRQNVVVSVHGEKEHVFRQAAAKLVRWVASAVSVTIFGGGSWIVEVMLDFCCAHGNE